MKIEMNLLTTPEKFFNLLLQSAKDDIEQAMNEKISTRDIVSGYTYQKTLENKLGAKGNARTILTKVKEPTIYEARFETARGVNTISYKIQKLEVGIQIIYEESYEPANKTYDLNNKIMTFFYNRSNQKRMKQMLKRMEVYLSEQEIQ